MNNSQRYIFGIYQINLVIQETFDYFLPLQADDKRVRKYLLRRKILFDLLQEGKPFADFCKNNIDKSIGKEETIKDFRNYIDEFYRDVYSEQAKIIQIRKNDQGNHYLFVDDSSTTKLLQYVVTIRERLNMIISGFLDTLKKQGNLEDEFYQLCRADERLYRATCMKVCAMVINTRFAQYNNAVNVEMQSHPGVDKSYLDNNVPSVKLLNVEMNRLVKLNRVVIENSSVKDKEFKQALALHEDCLQFFSGQKKLDKYNFGNGIGKPKTTEDFYKGFASIFNSILHDANTEFAKIFVKVYNDVVEFEKVLFTSSK